MKNNLIQTELDVNNNKIRVMRINDVDYISLTDLAKYSNPENPANVIIIGWIIRERLIILDYGNN